MTHVSWIPSFQAEPRNPLSLPGPDREVRQEEKTRRRGFLGQPLLKFFHATKPKASFSSLQAPIRTVLQKYLGRGEYPSFQSVAMFESSFVQVTRSGRHVYIHNHCNEAIIGIASTNVRLPLPNLMFVARPVAGQLCAEAHAEDLVLTRLIPLKFVWLSVHDLEKRIIKVKLINKRSYYLQFQASSSAEEQLFDRWLSLVHLLHHPPACYLRPQPTPCTGIDNLSVRVIDSEEEAEGGKKSPSPKKKQQQEKPTEAQEKEAEKPPRSRTGVFSIEEEYTETDWQILRANTALGKIDLYLNVDSYESYAGSTTRKCSSATFPSGSFLSSDLHSSSLPPAPSQFPVPRIEGRDSINIVTIFSAASKNLEGVGKREKKN